MTREDLLGRMDQAAATGDIVRLCALARLNWRLIDGELLTFSANRTAMAQQQLGAARQRAEMARIQDRMDDAENASIRGRAAMLGVSLPAVPSSPSWDGGAAGPALLMQVYATVHQGLVLGAQLQGEPDPGVAPELARAAADILDERIKPAAAVKLLGDKAPVALRMNAAIPWLGNKLVAPIIRGAAASALPLPELHRRMPDALLAGQPVPTAAGRAIDAMFAEMIARTQSPAFQASLVDTLLAQALAAGPEQAEALYASAIDAAEKTPAIEDDITVLRQLATASGHRSPGASTVRRAAALIDAMVGRPERRDDVAYVLAWVVHAAVGHDMTDLRPRLLASCQALLESSRLASDAAAVLVDATAELRAGR
jgi:hypothetical protein